MDVTEPGRIFTHAATRSSTRVRAIRFASAALAHVTRTKHLSVKESSRPLLFLACGISMVSHTCMAGYNTCPRTETFYWGTGPGCTCSPENKCRRRSNLELRAGAQ